MFKTSCYVLLQKRELQVLLSVLLQRRILLESLLEVRVSSELVATTCSYDSAEVVGHTVRVSYLVKSACSALVVLVQDLSKSCSVCVLLVEVLVSLSVVALSDVECAESRLYVLRARSLSNLTFCTLYVALDERNETEVSLCLRSR